MEFLTNNFIDLKASATLPLWQIVGGGYLLLIIGWYLSRLYIAYIMSDKKALELAARKNISEVWKSFMIWVFVLPGIVTIAVIAMLFSVAISDAWQYFNMPEIPIFLGVFALVTILIVLMALMIKALQIRKKRNEIDKGEVSYEE